MGVQVQKITRDIEILTDLQVLQELVDQANRVSELVGDDGDLTESQMTQDVMAAKASLKQLIDEADDKTLVLQVQGLNSSAWNAIVMSNTKTVDGRLVKDMQGIIMDAVPRMLVGAHWHGHDEPVTFAGDELDGLLGSMTDTQTADCLEIVQELNTPITTIPKEARELAD
jgi:hypothetical protein